MEPIMSKSEAVFFEIFNWIFYAYLLAQFALIMGAGLARSFWYFMKKVRQGEQDADEAQKD